jgi:hypothetical protein
MTDISKNTQVPQFDKTAVMRSAFYTPTIDEFHVGFEYETYNGKVWTKQIAETCYSDQAYVCLPIPDKDYGYDSENTRVKHIDKEDCILLGLKLKVWDNGSGYFEIGNYTIGIYGTDLFCTVSQNDYGNNIIRFSGDLKNKTELKHILRQVGCLAS